MKGPSTNTSICELQFSTGPQSNIVQYVKMSHSTYNLQLFDFDGGTNCIITVVTVDSTCSSITSHDSSITDKNIKFCNT